MNKKHLVLIIAAATAFSACDNDDDENKNSLSSNDKRFSEMAAQSNMAEIEFGQLAKANGTDSAVMAFADQMITEHTTAQDELKNITNDFGNVDWPQRLDEKHQRLYDTLMSKSGYQFDSLYLVSQVMDHEKADSLFRAGMITSSNDQLRSYASKYHPHIVKHLEMVEMIKTTRDSQQQNGND